MSPPSSESKNKSNKKPLAYSWTLMMKGTCSSETSIEFQRTALHYVLEDRIFPNHSCENLKYYNNKDDDNYNNNSNNSDSNLHIIILYTSIEAVGRISHLFIILFPSCRFVLRKSLKELNSRVRKPLWIICLIWCKRICLTRFISPAIYRLFQKELYNFEKVDKFIQRTYKTF
jgi:hypothetical protein